jgi:peptidoglycan/LPS O-acetylase OafA/YrhL
VYEAIGAARPSYPGTGEEADPPPGPVLVRVVVGQAFVSLVQSVRSGTFWWQVGAAFLASLCAGLLLTIAAAGGGSPPEVRGWAYMLTAASLVVISCLLALSWAGNRGDTAGQNPRETADEGWDK